MVYPESANFFYGEYRIRSFAGVHVEPRKTRIFILLFYSGALLSYASSVFSVFSVSVREEKFFHTQLL